MQITIIFIIHWSSGYFTYQLLKNVNVIHD